MSTEERLRKSVRAYSAYAALYNAFFWMPVFFLYFGQVLPIADVLRLEAIYYFAVVTFEVPSGYFSDKVGRKTTLLVSAACLVVAYLTFATGGTFEAFALAQVLLAAGIAFNSGTDTSFHYDSLNALGLENEYDEREAIIARTSLAASGFAALAGGLAAVFDLRAAYALSALAALLSIGAILRFEEPPHASEPSDFRHQIFDCLRLLTRPDLRWFFGFAVLTVVVNHVPYEFYQPYFELVGSALQVGDSTPLATGMHVAGVTLLSAWFARRSARFARRFGRTKVLLGAAAIQLAIIWTMGLVLHPLIALVIIFRGVPGALIRAPLNAAVVPKVPQSQRATYLSIQSLAGRLSFAGLLAGLSLVAGDSDGSWAALSSLLLVAGAASTVALVLLLALSRDARD